MLRKYYGQVKCVLNKKELLHTLSASLKLTEGYTTVP